MDGKEIYVERRAEPAAPVFERHAQTIIVSLITALLLFIGSMVYSGQGENAKTSVKLEFMTSQIVELKAKIDMMNSNYATKAELKELEARFHAHEIADNPRKIRL